MLRTFDGAKTKHALHVVQGVLRKARLTKPTNYRAGHARTWHHLSCLREPVGPQGASVALVDLLSPLCLPCSPRRKMIPPPAIVGTIVAPCTLIGAIIGGITPWFGCVLCLPAAILRLVNNFHVLIISGLIKVLQFLHDFCRQALGM